MPNLDDILEKQAAKTEAAAKLNGEAHEFGGDGDTWSLNLPKVRIHTLEQLIEYCKIDLSVWEVERFVANKWEMGFKNEADKAAALPLFQVKAFLRRRKALCDARDEIRKLIEYAKERAPLPFALRKGKITAAGNMLEIILADHHFGKLAWSEETGQPNYDVKIAKALWFRGLHALLARVAHLKFEQIWLVVGNDLLNSDDAQGRTTKGTVVATDIRYQKTFTVVTQTVIETIEILRALCARVKVLMISGNHDQLSVWHLGQSLECFFNKYDDVEIDNKPAYFKYHSFGQNMIMFTHTDKGKKTDYPLMMATEQPLMFGRTKFHEVHGGHLHTDLVAERHGVITRRFPALCPPDEWHAENGFVGNKRACQALHWSAEHGLQGIHIYVDDDSNIEKGKL